MMDEDEVPTKGEIVERDEFAGIDDGEDLFAEAGPGVEAGLAPEQPKEEKVVFFDDAHQSAAKPAAAAAPAAPAATATVPDAEIDAFYSSSAPLDESSHGPGKAGEETEDDDDANEDDELNAHAHDAIPMDRIKNGAANALKFWQWGMSKVQEKGKEVSDVLHQNENFRQASERVGEVYEDALKPGLEKVKVAASPIVDTLKEGAVTAGVTIKEGATTVYEKSKPALEELREKSQPTLDELSQRAEESWTVTKQKVGEFSERLGGSSSAKPPSSSGEDGATPSSGAPVVGASVSPFADI